jgi:hypothetical protein
MHADKLDSKKQANKRDIPYSPFFLTSTRTVIFYTAISRKNTKFSSQDIMETHA